MDIIQDREKLGSITGTDDPIDEDYLFEDTWSWSSESHSTRTTGKIYFWAGGAVMLNALPPDEQTCKDFIEEYHPQWSGGLKGFDKELTIKNMREENGAVMFEYEFQTGHDLNDGR